MTSLSADTPQTARPLTQFERWREGVAADIARLDAAYSRIELLLADRLPPAPTPATAEPQVIATVTLPPPPVGKRKKKAKTAATAAASVPSTSPVVPLPLSASYPSEGKPDQRLVTIAVPDAVVAHLVGKDGRGLRQAHDITGARVRAFHLEGSPAGKRHVAIRGTDQQVGDALVVLGKRIARRRIRTPAAKKKEPATAQPSQAAPATLAPRPTQPAPAPVSLPPAPPRSGAPPPGRGPSPRAFAPTAAPPSAVATPPPPRTPVVPLAWMTTAGPPSPAVSSVRMTTAPITRTPSAAATPTYSPMEIGVLYNPETDSRRCRYCGTYDGRHMADCLLANTPHPP